MTREHRVSRRVRLGAACARPAVKRALAVSARVFPSSSFQRRLESRRRWDRALALVRRAEARLEPWRIAAEGDADEGLFDRRLGAFYRALRRLLRTPAPDLTCLALKLDLAIAHDIAEMTGGKACLIALNAMRGASHPPGHPEPARPGAGRGRRTPVSFLIQDKIK